MRTIADRLACNAGHAIVGRRRELDLLLRCLDDDGPLVVHLHGISGIGKSALLGRLAELADRRDCTVITLDCSAVEPTESGLLRALAAQLGCQKRSPHGVAEALGASGSRILLQFDHYESLNLLDSWMRQVFVPTLPDNARVIFGARFPPAGRWIMSSEWHGLFQPLALEPLVDESAAALLAEQSVTGHAVQRIVEFARGHPLALKMACTLASRFAARADVPMDAVVRDLSRIYLDGIDSRDLRRVLRAACVVRHVSRPLVEAVAPDSDSEDLLQRLADLPFVEPTVGGYAIHDAIREAIAAEFEAVDPEGFAAARRAAWRHLRDAVAAAGGEDLWRYTVDLIYLARNPVVRSAFFPRDAASLHVEPATPEHRRAILSMAARHDPPESVRILERWWKAAPAAFSVVLRGTGEPAGFHLLFDPGDVPEEMILADPMTAGWWRDLRASRLPRGQRVLFLRRWLGDSAGDAPSPVQAASWLDIKRSYMEMRPALRRVYLAVTDPEPYAGIATELGFAMRPDLDAMIGDSCLHTAMLDMGPASVDGWLGWLVERELGADAGEVLDVDAQALRLDSGQVPLTRLEFEVARYLRTRIDSPVARDTLLNDVWGRHFDGGSNVVDSVVAGLRRKLGSRAGVIGTVRGRGYVWRSARDDRSPRS